MEQPYPPHLKKVLKSYQEAATTSLQGPNSFMATWRPADKMGAPTSTGKTSGTSAPSTGATTNDKKLTNARYTEYDPFLAPPPFPIQQPPIITPSDQSSWERSETILESETISCFIVGGEKRLCLPQILNTVLRDFSLQQINSVCDDLHIFCSRCNSEQLEVLKMTGILPLNAPSCGLITKTDAERLCAELLRHSTPKPDISLPSEKFFSFKVYHECFGKCTGIYTPDLYTSPTTCCVECIECHALFTPRKFVCHAHKAKENRTCHWGFDSANWRSYLLLARDQDRLEELQEHLEEMKMRFDYPSKYKRKQISIDVSYDPAKRFRLEDPVPYRYPYPLPWDPTCVYLCPEDGPWAHMSAFKPWSPAITKEEKAMIAMPALLSPQIRENNLTALPAHLSHDPPVLQNPERVVPMSESKRFERHFQPNVALAPITSQHNHTKPLMEIVPKAVVPSSKSSPQEENAKVRCVTLNEIDSSSSLTDGDDVFSDCSVSDDLTAVSISDNLKKLQLLLEDHKIDGSLQKKILKEVDLIVSRCQSQAFRNTKMKHVKEGDTKVLPGEASQAERIPEKPSCDEKRAEHMSKNPSPAATPESRPKSLVRTASTESLGRDEDDHEDNKSAVLSVPKSTSSQQTASATSEEHHKVQASADKDGDDQE